jgi:translation initiation factor IF-2
VLHLRNTKPVKLSPLEEDMFKGDVFYISEVKFLRDRNGKVTGFEVSNGRAKGIGFEKINN